MIRVNADGQQHILRQGEIHGLPERVGDEEDEVAFGEGDVDVALHGLLELVLGTKVAWRVDVDGLVVAFLCDAYDVVACGLGFVGDDGKRVVDEVVEEGGLACVGVADEQFNFCND